MSSHTAPPAAKRRRKIAGSIADGSLVQFYSKSKDVDDLGLGMAGWRKVLSNFHMGVISVNGKKYPSVEHYFHAAKAEIATNRPSTSVVFEVGGTIGNLSALDAKKAGGKHAKKHFPSVQWPTTFNATAWDNARDKVTMRGLKAKLATDLQFRSILTELKRRKLRLLHFERGGARSYWGGSLDKDTGAVKGKNRLGQLMHELMNSKLYQVLEATTPSTDNDNEAAAAEPEPAAAAESETAAAADADPAAAAEAETAAATYADADAWATYAARL